MSSEDSQPRPRDADASDFDENGVDLTLVRYSLRLTPTERLKAVENFMKTMATVRRPAAAGR
jgi:hypothetical protein